jgi:hypothetical protein
MNKFITDLIGKIVFIRTVTHYFVGRLLDIDNNFFAINQASWIAETDEWSRCSKQGKLNEAYPYNPETTVFVNVDSLVDVFEWPFTLPTEPVLKNDPD